MAQRFCRICSGWHDLDSAWPDACSGHFSRAPSKDGIQIIKDIEPYRSAITREIIPGRKQHRDHLKAHRCIEVGNEHQKEFKPTYTSGLGEDIKRAMEIARG